MHHNYIVQSIMCENKSVQLMQQDHPIFYLLQNITENKVMSDNSILLIALKNASFPSTREGDSISNIVFGYEKKKEKKFKIQFQSQIFLWKGSN